MSDKIKFIDINDEDKAYLESKGYNSHGFKRVINSNETVGGLVCEDTYFIGKVNMDPSAIATESVLENSHLGIGAQVLGSRLENAFIGHSVVSECNVMKSSVMHSHLSSMSMIDSEVRGSQMTHGKVIHSIVTDSVGRGNIIEKSHVHEFQGTEEHLNESYYHGSKDLSAGDKAMITEKFYPENVMNVDLDGEPFARFRSIDDRVVDIHKGNIETHRIDEMSDSLSEAISKKSLEVDTDVALTLDDLADLEVDGLEL